MTTLSDLVAEVAENAAKKTKRITTHYHLLETLAAQGIINKVNPLDVKYGLSIKVQKSDLPAIRKIVGPLEVRSKRLADDFDTTNEVVVILHPQNEDFPVKVEYRTQYQDDGKCHVHEESVPATVSKRLVCRA